MSTVLISIKPHWCELIANGQKTVEVRKTAPKGFFKEFLYGEYFSPYKVYIYCTKSLTHLYRWRKEINHKGLGEFYTTDHNEYSLVPQGYLNGKVIGEFKCDNIECFTTDYRMDKEQTDRISKESCLSFGELADYEHNSHYLYAWHISDLKIYDEPKELSEFKRENRHCHYNDLGLAIPKCEDCKKCQLAKPPQSWCYVEELKN